MCRCYKAPCLHASTRCDRPELLRGSVEVVEKCGRSRSTDFLSFLISTAESLKYTEICCAVRRQHRLKGERLLGQQQPQSADASKAASPLEV